MDIPKLYLPDVPPMLSVYEEPRLQEMTSPEMEELDDIKSRLAMPPKFWDFDTLLHIQQATDDIEDSLSWNESDSESIEVSDSYSEISASESDS